MDNLLKHAKECACEYLRGLNGRPVFPTREAIKGLTQFDFPLPERSTDPSEVIGLLDRAGSPATVTSAGGRYFGFVVGGSHPASLAANWLAGAWDQNAGFYVSSPVSAKLEEVALDWIYSIFGLPSESAGAFVTGTTMANFASLAAARHELLRKQGWDVESMGLFGAPPFTVIVGEEAHSTLFKAISLLGMGRDRVVRVPVDHRGRMRSDAIPSIEGPTILCCQAGNVNSGDFDPIDSICDIAHEKDAWVHVDGAFGIWVKASSKYEHLVNGVDKADSWATDLHKWLNVPYDSGLAIVRNAAALKAAMSLSAAYLPDDERREPFYYTPETSRKARGVEAWAVLYSLGREGLTDLIERTCLYAKQMATGLENAGYSILNNVVINQILVSFGNENTTRKIIKAVQDNGTCWCGGTVWQGHAAMRISVSSWATTEEDIRQSLDAILRVASRYCR